MRIVITAILVVFPLAASAAVQGSSTCSKGADSRTIEVAVPGSVGKACDLTYIRDGGKNVGVPYHADNSAGFCAERATALIKSLQAQGYQCGVQTAEAPKTDQLADSLALGGGTAPAQTVAEVPASPGAATADAALPPVTTLAQPAEAPEAPPSAAVAANAPTPLVPQNASLSVKGPIGEAVGKVGGATPGPGLAAKPQSPQIAAASSPPVESSAFTSARPSADVIRDLLAAQTAAWNEGDLDGFMRGYWNSPELKFVSGTTITKGWAPTLNRYRDKYGQGAGMGRLAFENLEVNLPAVDVAVATGRFRLERGGNVEGGAFTLVFKRFNGLWRIVLDHSAGDPVPMQNTN